jgi:hypothetical protein
MLALPVCPDMVGFDHAKAIAWKRKQSSEVFSAELTNDYRLLTADIGCLCDAGI